MLETMLDRQGHCLLGVPLCLAQRADGLTSLFNTWASV